MTGRLKKFARFFFSLLVFLALIALCLVMLFGALASRRETESYKDAAPSRGSFVRSQDGDIFVQQRGPLSGKPVLFIHGTGAWSEMWDETLEYLSQAGFRAIAIDLPPFGYSEKILGADYGRVRQAERMVDVIDALGIGNITLVGHSFGASPTVEAAFRLGKRVDALVLVDPALGLDFEGSMSKLGSTSPPFFMRFPRIRSLVAASTITNPYATRQILSSLVAEKGALTPERIAMLQEPLSIAGMTPAVAEWLGQFFAIETTAMSNRSIEYQNFYAPTLIVWGELDSVTPLRQGRMLRELLPHSDLFVMGGVGHIPHIENPEFFNQELVKFLRKQK